MRFEKEHTRRCPTRRRIASILTPESINNRLQYLLESYAVINEIIRKTSSPDCLLTSTIGFLRRAPPRRTLALSIRRTEQSAVTWCNPLRRLISRPSYVASDLRFFLPLRTFTFRPGEARPTDRSAHKIGTIARFIRCVTST